MLRLTARAERFPIAGAFTIARGSKTDAELVVATVEDTATGARGQGECVPYARYGETVVGVVAELEAFAPALAAGVTRTALQVRMPPGAARNALDCALWDLEAKQSGVPVWRRAGLAAPKPVITAFTLSLDTPAKMGDAARVAAHRPLLKLKLGPEGALERVAAVAAAAPKARLIVDANEAWSLAVLGSLGPDLKRLGVTLIEQPLPAGEDAGLQGYAFPIPLCADESARGLAGLREVARRYQVINIKLDKTGGLTEALALAQAARARGLKIMLGCMVATSLAMAPACLLAQGAEFVDLDGPLLLARDRVPGLRYEGSLLFPPAPELWG